MDTLSKVASVTQAIVVGIISVLVVIAPMTKSDKDNKFLDILRFLEDKLLSFLFPALAKAKDAVAPAETPKA